MVEVSLATEVSDELVAAFARLIPQLSASAAPPDEAGLTDIVSSPCVALLVARDIADGRKIVGALTLVVFRIPTGVRGWIEDVVVDSSARGRGVGELLTREAMRLACEKGAQTIDLTSRPSREAARRLYEKMGFVVRDTGVFRYTRPGRGKAG
jgi:ribosomal protein S18 acetylase RimI-like enzyme